jgi:hypothetical protein
MPVIIPGLCIQEYMDKAHGITVKHKKSDSFHILNLIKAPGRQSKACPGFIPNFFKILARGQLLVKAD